MEEQLALSTAVNEEIFVKTRTAEIDLIICKQTPYQVFEMLSYIIFLVTITIIILLRPSPKRNNYDLHDLNAATATLIKTLIYIGQLPITNYHSWPRERSEETSLITR